MGWKRKRPPEFDNGDGTFSVGGFRFVKFGQRMKIYLDIPASTHVGCHCANPDKWENIYDNLTDQQKLALPVGTTEAYYACCGRCTERQRRENREKSKARSAAIKLEQQNRKQGEAPSCRLCPDGIDGKFTLKEDGTYFTHCDYHRAVNRRYSALLWDYKQTLIDPETQALCRKCPHVFAPAEMKQKWYNVRGDFVTERQYDLCPRHWEYHHRNSREMCEAHKQKLVQEMLDHLASRAAGRVGCAHKQCPLDRQGLLQVLVTRHGDALGTRLFTKTFDYDHDPRRADSKNVTLILNDVRRARERSTTKPLCAATCHSFKTWSEFEWKSYFDEGGYQHRPTRHQVSTYMGLKLRRFEGKDPHQNHHGKCGCQGYVDDEGNEYKCPFEESLTRAKQAFESTQRLGRSTEIDSKYGFLTMYVLDHDDIRKKTIEFAAQENRLTNDDSVRIFVEEMNGATLRCRVCDRFKTILCGDTVIEIHESASVWITREDDMEDPALAITVDDEFNNIM